MTDILIYIKIYKTYRRKVCVLLLATMCCLKTEARLFSINEAGINIQQLHITAGYQSKKFDWSIAGDVSGSNPNIFSELIWKHKQEICTEITPEVLLGRNWLFHFPLRASYTLDGEVSDSDYEEDNREGRSFFSKASSDGSYSFSTIPSLGPRIHIHPSTQLIIQLSYSYTVDKYYLRDKKKLNSYYKTNYSGPGISIIINCRLNKKNTITGMTNIGIINYYAKANWNLVKGFSHPTSFEHKAKGITISPSIKLTNNITKGISLISEIRSHSLSSGKGIDTLYKSDGSIIKTMLNGVNQTHFSLSTGILLSF